MRKLIENRRKGRVLALEALFQYEFRPEDVNDINKFDWWDDTIPEESLNYAKQLFYGTLRNLKDIDKIIRKYSINWEFDRINKVDKSILRLSIYQLLFETDVNYKVIIDEAVEISKCFSTEKSYKFINGILDKFCIDYLKKNEEKDKGIGKNKSNDEK